MLPKAVPARARTEASDLRRAKVCVNLCGEFSPVRCSSAGVARCCCSKIPNLSVAFTQAQAAIRCPDVRQRRPPTIQRCAGKLESWKVAKLENAIDKFASSKPSVGPPPVFPASLLPRVRGPVRNGPCVCQAGPSRRSARRHAMREGRGWGA